MKFLSSSLMLCLFVLQAICQPLNTNKLDSLFNTLANKKLAMGSLAISINGKAQYKKAVGYADLNNQIAANTGTRYRVGSVSKMFTAVMVFQLIEEKKLSLTDKLSHFYGDVPDAENITISHLLNHRSGLHSYTEDTDYSTWMSSAQSHAQMLAIIRKLKPDFAPGTKAAYSNTNYLLLSYIIEQIDQKPYSEALKQRITLKTGLKDTYFGDLTDISKNESCSYKYNEGNWYQIKETDLSIHSGAGSIVSTPTDLVKFIEALYEGKLIGSASLNEMQTMKDGYGMGMFPFSFEDKTAFGHNGRIEEFYAAVRYFPEEKMAMAYCTNGILYPRADILTGIQRICFNKPYAIPFTNLTPLGSHDLDQYTGMYTSDNRAIVVNVGKNQSELLIETRGKAFEVQPIGKHYFMQQGLGYFFEFEPKKNTLLIKETDNIYYLKRQ
ncbi:serine hydrolase [Emticicia sp. TH156]|uniref:serine hydrolase domain-containing protein n=1 Tax=Emticicia sp. TH156 TaxID=2067454 RepID=UPI000C785E63|nr:serine hydrolase domain-containing protein [Emticicia sp. TH156]PLK45830.1 peptidase [Emticicia sp. TH156]